MGNILKGRGGTSRHAAVVSAPRACAPTMLMPLRRLAMLTPERICLAVSYRESTCMENSLSQFFIRKADSGAFGGQAQQRQLLRLALTLLHSGTNGRRGASPHNKVRQHGCWYKRLPHVAAGICISTAPFGSLAADNSLLLQCHIVKRCVQQLPHQ